MKKFLVKLSNEWYFFPVVGALVFVLFNGGIFVVLSIRNHSNTTQASSVELPSTPESTQQTQPTATPTPKTDPTPDLRATATPKPKPSVTPTPKATATPTPTPTATPYENEEVKITSPSNESNISGKKFTVKVEPRLNESFTKVVIYLNGLAEHTFTSAPYEHEFEKSSGKYEIHAVAIKDNGGEISSSKVRIGVDGTQWNQSDSEATNSGTTP